MSWGFGLELSSNDSAFGLNINIIDRRDPGNPNSTWPKVKIVDKGIKDILSGTIIEKYYPRYVERLVDNVNTNFNYRFNSLHTSLQNALRDQGRLFLPGNGSLFFKNGTFNNQGDFITEVRFNGTGVPNH